MTSIIKADIYRLTRSKGIYITFGLLLALVALIVCTSVEVVVGMQMENLEGALGGVSEKVIYNGVNIAAILYSSMDNLAYFLLPLVVLSSAPMFSHGTVKNSLASGTSRTSLYLSKLALSSALCVLMVLLYMVSGMLLATAIRGFGGPVESGYWLNILKTCGSQLFVMLSLNSVGLFLVFTTKRTAIVNGVYISFCLIPGIVLILLSNVNETLIDLYKYDLLGNVKIFAYFSGLTGQDIATAFIVGAVYFLLSTAAGLLLFRRCEIK